MVSQQDVKWHKDIFLMSHAIAAGFTCYARLNRTGKISAGMIYLIEDDMEVLKVYSDILQIICTSTGMNFEEASTRLQESVDADTDFLSTLKQIGTIPESIPHDSTEEKLFAKASDAVLSRAFREIGLKSTVIKARGDSADVIAESPIYGYTLVADAKAFRLSRTAKNQKDYKVVALSGWRQDSDFAVLCAPYFHYPSKLSQIYAQALDHNVCLLSWEHLIFLIEQGIAENEAVNLSLLWNFSDIYSHEVLCSDMNKCFLNRFDDYLLTITGVEKAKLMTSFQMQISTLIERSREEKSFWNGEIEQIKAYSRDQAIRELIQEKKIAQKIEQIDCFVGGLEYGK